MTQDEQIYNLKHLVIKREREIETLKEDLKKSEDQVDELILRLEAVFLGKEK